MDNREQQIMDHIINQINTSKFDMRPLIKDIGITNYINSVGKNFGFNNLAMEDNDLFNKVSNALRVKLKENKQIQMKNLLNETDSIITNVNMLNYQDDDVVKIIKAKFNKEFKEYKLEKIVTNDEGPFYTLEVSAKVDADIKSDPELKKFMLHQMIHNFRGEFMKSISEIVPVVNVKISSYQFTKNSDRVKFGATVLISNTNNRDWVTGVIKPIDEEKKEDTLTESVLTELRIKSNLVAISLMKAIDKYKANQIDRSMLETAIKACKRNELEKYVMDTLNLKVTEPKEGDDEGKDNKKESVEENVEASPKSDEQVAFDLFKKHEYDHDWQRQSVKDMRDMKLEKDRIISVINLLAGKEYFDDREFFQ